MDGTRYPARQTNQANIAVNKETQPHSVSSLGQAPWNPDGLNPDASAFTPSSPHTTPVCVPLVSSPPPAPYPVAAVSTLLGKLNGPADGASPPLSPTQPPPSAPCPVAAVSTLLVKLNGPADGVNPSPSPTQPPSPAPYPAAAVSTPLGKLNGTVDGALGTPSGAQPKPRPAPSSARPPSELGREARLTPPQDPRWLPSLLSRYSPR